MRVQLLDLRCFSQKNTAGSCLVRGHDEMHDDRGFGRKVFEMQSLSIKHQLAIIIYSYWPVTYQGASVKLISVALVGDQCSSCQFWTSNCSCPGANDCCLNSNCMTLQKHSS